MPEPNPGALEIADMIEAALADPDATDRELAGLVEVLLIVDPAAANAGHDAVVAALRSVKLPSERPGQSPLGRLADFINAVVRDRPDLARVAARASLRAIRSAAGKGTS
jgi:hypothetical protein